MSWLLGQHYSGKKVIAQVQTLSLTLRAFSLCGVAWFHHAKSAKCKRAISLVSHALDCDLQAASRDVLFGAVSLDFRLAAEI
jgi:hypothetical protein